MKSIIYVGMDVHKASFTISCFSVTTQETFATVKISPDAKAIRNTLMESVSHAVRNANLYAAMRLDASVIRYTIS